jgi:hypothetical protein
MKRKLKETSEKYHNTDPRCNYPWEPCRAGYCWSYALHVTGDPQYKDIEKICKLCEYWKEV